MREWIRGNSDDYDPEAPPMLGTWMRGGSKHVDETGTIVRVQPGAGSYEDSFRYYWLVAGWVFLAYHSLAMLILLGGMINSGLSYLWVPHLIGTTIIVMAMGLTACIYRFILFPPPGYYSRSPLDAGCAALPALNARDYAHSGSSLQPQYPEGAQA